VALLDIYVPRKTRVKESHERERRLKDKLGKVYVVMIALEIEEVNVFKCEGVVS
jgi:hypothetical protein